GIGEGSELQAPMARVVIGGLMSSTVITLVLIPIIYAIFEGRTRIRGIDEEEPEFAGAPQMQAGD
ncbi:MAG: efflux RND transporter permease subunit, partial [Verrucomicrobiales bacterium]|nr:efflux RND transporter permease subunit [Verrucomicrobiales bacterium]